MEDLKKKLVECIVACNHCFDACLKEKDVQMMVQCIRLDKACSEICSLALSQLASNSPFASDVLRICVKACEECAHECGKHHNQHCRDCAKACKECAEACKANA